MNNKYLEKIASTRYVREMLAKMPGVTGLTAGSVAKTKGAIKDLGKNEALSDKYLPVLGDKHDRAYAVLSPGERGSMLKAYRERELSSTMNRGYTNKQDLLDHHRRTSRLALGSMDLGNKSKLPG
jgi:hypothetical protein